MTANYALVFGILSNFTLSVALVLLNKALVVYHGFHLMTVLTLFHFISSMIVCMLGVFFNYIPYKAVNSYVNIIRLSLGSLLSIVFMNYCLAYSSVGFYQVAKLGCIPMTLLLEYLTGIKYQNLSLALILSLTIVIIGMAMVIQSEIKVQNSLGIFWAILGIITTSAAQIYFNPLKKDLGLDAMQLLLHTSPWLAFGSFVSIPLMENQVELYKVRLTTSFMLTLLLSSLTAVAFNISNYSLLSMVTPITYNLLGHLKTIAIILGGCYFFSSWPSHIMTIGITLAIIGVILYRQETDRQAAEAEVLSKLLRNKANMIDVTESRDNKV